jgi:hypothetical protein
MPIEVATANVFLALPLGSWKTGEVIHVRGGLEMEGRKKVGSKARHVEWVKRNVYARAAFESENGALSSDHYLECSKTERK